MKMTMTNKTTDDVYSDENVVPSNWMKFSKIEDRIFGTLICVREQENRLPNAKPGEMVKVYEIKSESGEFHDTDEKKNVIEPAIQLQPGEIWNIGGSAALDNQLRNVKLGTKVAIKFTAEKPSQTKGFNPQKIKKVYVPKGQDGKPVMDTEWVAEQEFGPNSKEPDFNS